MPLVESCWAEIDAGEGIKKIIIGLACVASASVWFRSKEIPRKGTFGFDRARNETRALLAPLFSRSLTLVPRSFLVNRTETLATQAIIGCIYKHPTCNLEQFRNQLNDIIKTINPK